MADVPFGPLLAIDPTTNLPVANAAGKVYAVTDVTFATPLDVKDLSGLPLPNNELLSGPLGIFDEFLAPNDNYQVNWKSGSTVILLSSYKGLLTYAQTIDTKASDALAATDALEAAPAVLPAGGVANQDILWRGPDERSGIWAPPPQGTGGGGTGGSVSWSSILNIPSTFPPSEHQHPVANISDSTVVGRAVVTAADAAAARAAIGAGTGSGTSNLQIGTTSTTAAAGNHSHTASQIPFTPAGGVTATDVQTAIAQAATLGGGSGTSAVMVWRYTAGSWPAMPATQPVGVQKVDAIGPSYPPSVPSWVGIAAGKVPLSYKKVAVA